MQVTTNNQSPINQTLLRTSAVAFFMMPLCYVAMFVFFFVMLDIPHSSPLIEKIGYMAEQKVLISFAYFIGYIVFGCLLLIGVQGVNALLHVNKSELAKFASAFGMMWFVLMMCSGMIAMVGVDVLPWLLIRLQFPTGMPTPFARQSLLELALEPQNGRRRLFHFQISSA